MCEMAYARGASTLLVELPVRLIHSRPSDDDTAFALDFPMPLEQLTHALLGACLRAAAPNKLPPPPPPVVPPPLPPTAVNAPSVDEAPRTKSSSGGRPPPTPHLKMKCWAEQ